MYDLCSALIGQDTNFREGLWTWEKKMIELYANPKKPSNLFIPDSRFLAQQSYLILNIQLVSYFIS